jgi:hypothetical protein
MPRNFLIGETSDLPRGCPAIFSTKVPWFHRSHIIGARVWGRRRFCRGRRYRTRPARSVRTSGGRWNLPRRAPPQITSPGRDQGSTFRAARKAGIPFIGVLCGGSSERRLTDAGAIAVYKDPADLLIHYATSPICQPIVGRQEALDAPAALPSAS